MSRPTSGQSFRVVILATPPTYCVVDRRVFVPVQGNVLEHIVEHASSLRKLGGIVPRKKIGGGASAHITLRIPSDLHERLVKAAGSHGTAEEIRRRLEASFAPDPFGKDPKTRELAAAIAGMADEASWYYRPWHEDPFTFEILQEGIGKLLAYYRPKGEV